MRALQLPGRDLACVRQPSAPGRRLLRPSPLATTPEPTLGALTPAALQADCLQDPSDVFLHLQVGQASLLPVARSQQRAHSTRLLRVLAPSPAPRVPPQATAQHVAAVGPVQDSDIGQGFALFYEAYATYLELKGSFERAGLVFQEGIARSAFSGCWVHAPSALGPGLSPPTPAHQPAPSKVPLRHALSHCCLALSVRGRA